MGGKPADTVTLTHPKFASDFPRTLGAHDIGLRDLLESAQLVGPLPKLHLIAISISEIQSMQMELSERVEKSLPNIVKVVLDMVNPSVEERA